MGKNLPTRIGEDVRVRLEEVDGGPDSVELRDDEEAGEEGVVLA